MNEAIENEINELDELVASLSMQNKDNSVLVSELKFEIDRLKGKLYYEQQSIPVGGKISS